MESMQIAFELHLQIGLQGRLGGALHQQFRGAAPIACRTIRARDMQEARERQTMCRAGTHHAISVVQQVSMSKACCNLSLRDDTTSNVPWLFENEIKKLQRIHVELQASASDCGSR